MNSKKLQSALSKVVRHDMTSLDLNVKTTAKYMGVCTQTLSNQLNDHTAWSIERLCEVANVLNAEPDDLLYRSRLLVEVMDRKEAEEQSK